MEVRLYLLSRTESKIGEASEERGENCNIEISCDGSLRAFQFAVQALCNLLRDSTDVTPGGSRVNFDIPEGILKEFVGK